MKRIFLLALVLGTGCLGLKAQTSWSATSLDGNTYRNGNVGIGTDNPYVSLDIKSTSGATRLRLQSLINQNSFITFTPDDGYANQYNLGYNDLNDVFSITGSSFPSELGMHLLQNGNVGIGTTAPGEILHVKGNLYIEGTDSYESGWKKNFLYWRGHSLIMGSKPGVYTHNRIELKPGGASQGKLISSLQLYDANNINDQTLKILITSTGATYFNGGNVGIGTNNPSNELEVNGTIRSKEVKVEASPWPDYVFTEKHELMDLQEVNTYIQQNGHLPEIPTAKEVEENGVSLGEMNARLLQKIEELTLYVIELKKENEKQSENLDCQGKRINELEEIIKNYNKIYYK